MALSGALRNAVGRTCGVTGLFVDRSSERLIIVNAVTAVLWLATGGVMALLIALTRWPAVHLISSPEWFYRLVSAHGAAMLVFWILFFEVAGLIFGGTILLNQPMVAPKVGWLAYGMMLFGSVAAAVVVLSGYATVMFTAYPPLEASHWFYLFILVFAVGALIAVIHFLVQITRARITGRIRTLPLFTFGLVVAAILALFTLASGTAALIPAWLARLGVIETADPGVYRLLFWGFGHGAQQVNLAAMVAIWYGLASLMVGARPINEGLSRLAFLLYVLFIQMGSMHHILVDPGLSHWARGINTSYFLYAAVMGSMIHAFTIPASVEVAQREKGHTGSLFAWLRNAPWGSPGFSAFALSFAMFGILGGISGVIMGGIQLNLIAHNTLIVPAHFHMTVVAGTTLAFMGISYYLVPLITRRDLFLPGWAKVQPYIFTTGMLIFGIAMGLAGHWGVPRRHWDISLSAYPFAAGTFDGPRIQMALAITALGATIAIIGGTMYVIIAAGTVFLGKRNDVPNIGHVDAGAFAPPAPAAPHVGRGFEAPGTMTLAMTWLALFVVLYAVSWYEFSSIQWGIR
ncbi:MAG: cbb3-type cytochrome c oxidase subunit I [Ardenticatenales bacterium]|nr:cbb3-type cytochrome c oxidase subunit I [Ardenticatenales bacterium]